MPEKKNAKPKAKRPEGKKRAEHLRTEGEDTHHNLLPNEPVHVGPDEKNQIKREAGPQTKIRDSSEKVEAKKAEVAKAEPQRVPEASVQTDADMEEDDEDMADDAGQEEAQQEQA